MHDTNAVLLSVFAVFVAAQVGSEIAQRLKLPSVVGQIAGGVVVGQSVLGWASANQALEILAEIGAVILLFSVGLETKVSELRKIGKNALWVGVLGVIVPFATGAAWALATGFTVPHAMFVAAAFVATSVGITARVMQDLGVISSTEGRVILGAAVIDDILAMLLLGAVTALQSKEGVDVVHLLTVLGQTLAFLAVVVAVGTKVMRRSQHLLDSPMDPESPFILSLIICLGLAVAAAYTGLAAIIGAFLAGIILAETQHRERLEVDTKPLQAFVVPFFFAYTGMQVNARLLGDWGMIGAVALVSLLAILSKLAGAWLGARSLGSRPALVVGIGMIPRGEVGIIIASLGRQAEVFGDWPYAVIIAMSLITSVVAPPLLAALLRRQAAT